MLFQKIKIFLLSLSFISCTQIHYVTKSDFPVYGTLKNDHQSYVESLGKKEFYLWGLTPKKHYVEVDTMLMERGIESASRVTIEEFVSLKSFFATVFSFGMYAPVDYKISAWGVKFERE